MKWWVPTAFLACLAALTQETSGSRILFISAVCAKSQKGFFSGVAKALADNGHQVTIVSPFKPSKVHPNIREIYLEGVEITKYLPNLFTSKVLSGPRSLADNAPRVCSDALASEEVQALLKEEFDLGIISVVFNNCFFSLFHQLKIPYIYVCPLSLAAPAAAVVGNPGFPSFVNSPFIHISHPFTFPERLFNAVVDALSTNYFVNFIAPYIGDECRRRGLCADDLPLMEMAHNASLILVNSVKSVETPVRPYFPSVVHVGGIHCHDSKPLPKDLERWIEGAGEDGFIFFSLGSVVVPSSMPEEYRQILLKVFGSLKQRVLWKWDKENVTDLPPNVRISKWLPQQDILGHPRLRLFITHGGALSTQESMYHGTPALGLPVFGDQLSNMMEAQLQGWARVVIWEEMTFDTLRDTINFVIHDKKLRAEAKRRSTLMHDLPLTPAQEVNYWVDYVIRHRGAPHLRPPTLSMPMYKVYNIDVWLTILGIASVVLYIVLKLLLAICRFCCSKRKAKKD